MVILLDGYYVENVIKRARTQGFLEEEVFEFLLEAKSNVNPDPDSDTQTNLEVLADLLNEALMEQEDLEEATEDDDSDLIDPEEIVYVPPIPLTARLESPRLAAPIEVDEMIETVTDDEDHTERNQLQSVPVNGLVAVQAELIQLPNLDITIEPMSGFEIHRQSMEIIRQARIENPNLIFELRDRNAHIVQPTILPQELAPVYQEVNNLPFVVIEPVREEEVLQEVLDAHPNLRLDDNDSSDFSDVDMRALPDEISNQFQKYPHLHVSVSDRENTQTEIVASENQVTPEQIVRQVLSTHPNLELDEVESTIACNIIEIDRLPPEIENLNETHAYLQFSMD